MLVDDANDRILRYIGNKKTLGPNDFPAGVTTIDAGAFAYHDELSSVELPSSIMSIGNGAFAKCLTLYMVKLNKGILTMGKNVFSNCPSLTVYVPSGTYTGGWDPDFAKGVRVAYR
ncbi:MAG: leucine-rich repeat domain-containing protein [Bacilli bacterium]|nr:leucine-rich repeat domain-containing protein [Bacilli bacterium]